MSVGVAITTRSIFFVISFLKSVEVLINGKSFFALIKFDLDLSEIEIRLKKFEF